MRWVLLFVLVIICVAKISHAADGTVLVIDKIAPKNGAFVGVVDSSQTLVNTSGFTQNLSGADTTVQHALNTIDQLATGGGSGCVNPGTQFCIYKTNGAYFTFDGTTLCLYVNSVVQQCWSTAAAATSFLLAEDGGFFLLEDGGKMILQ